MVAMRGFGLTLVGLGVGVSVAVASTRAMRSVLYGVTPTDSTTFSAVVSALGLVACVASVIPAARAARVDPMVVLRDV